MALTDKAIRAAKADDKPTYLFDGHGLHLAVQPNGVKLWRWKYRFNGAARLMSFGQYPVVTLVKARELHLEARQLLASGVDPMARRKAEKAATRASAANSFQSVAVRWLAHWRVGKSPHYADYVDRRLIADVFPRLGARPIADIEAPEVVAVVRAIEDRGVRDLAKRALETIGQIFRYAIANGYARRNPASEIKPRDILKASQRVNFARVDAKELPELLRSIEVYKGTPVTRLAMRLLSLTFVRTRELIGARWSEFDLENARWDIPAERMKMKTPHIVPLSRQSVEVLRSLHRLTGTGELVFPGDRNTKQPMSNNAILGALERMGYQHRMTGHGFRGVASTILHEYGSNHEHIELQLAHARRNAVSAAYNHALYLEPRRRMMQWYADHLDALECGSNVTVGNFGDAVA
jgi:integrase